MRRTVDPEEIIALTAIWFRVRRSDITGKRRSREFCLPRSAAIFLCRKLTIFSFPAIARQFRRDHSTVMKAYYRFIERLKRDEPLALAIKRMEKALDEGWTTKPTAYWLR